MPGRLRIMGTRGIPAQHGGFETFAEDLALYLVQRNWDVSVYCQETGSGPIRLDRWKEVERITIPVAREGAVGTVIFDWRATRHASQSRDLVLTLGYNTAVFCSLLRLKGVPNLINMDGLEWRRTKYGLPQKTWLFLNEIAGSWLGNHLIADHPEIKNHLTWWVGKNKVTTIPYGSEVMRPTEPTGLAELGIEPNQFALVIARPEPENSILEIVRAFSQHRREYKLVVLGNYDPRNRYHAAVRSAGGPDVIFPGAIYEKTTVQSLRRFTRLYIHGHTVGGTNPSLVEALSAGSPVLAHDNRFNRWVAGDGARYFRDEESCALQLDELLGDSELLAEMSERSQRRHADKFTLSQCLMDYETLLTKWLPAQAS